MTGLIHEIQADALDQSILVSTLLRKVKVAAAKLNIATDMKWVELELNGYRDVPREELPVYRQLRGVLKVFNPYHGYQPLIFGDPKMADLCSQASIGQALPELESILATNEENLQFNLSPRLKKMLMDAIRYQLEPALMLSRATIVGIVDAVRNLIVDWSLQMEAAGVLGEGMTFSQREREKAAPAAQQFNIQNLGVLGNVTDQAQVSNYQTAIREIDASALRNLLGQVAALQGNLPTPTREKLGPVLADLQKESVATVPDQSKIRALLLSAKMICEGAAGNLVASGVVAAIASLVH